MCFIRFEFSVFWSRLWTHTQKMWSVSILSRHETKFYGFVFISLVELNFFCVQESFRPNMRRIIHTSGLQWIENSELEDFRWRRVWKYQHWRSHWRHDVNVSDVQTVMNNNGGQQSVIMATCWHLELYDDTSVTSELESLNSIQWTNILKVVHLSSGRQTWRSMMLLLFQLLTDELIPITEEPLGSLGSGSYWRVETDSLSLPGADEAAELHLVYSWADFTSCRCFLCF